MHLLIVGFGGFLGANARYSISKRLNHESALPLGTLTVNLSGAFLLGVITGAKADIIIVLLFGTGFMGAYTTFSTLKLEMLKLFFKKNKKDFILYTIVTYGAGITLAYFGFLVGSFF
ncbi:fluoride efflux transporter CrcB [Paenibacillus sp. BSR1-1]|uniref:fluoride efflux transporter CrcB n=1 Tax=Paenibacillus sp. BSR1-1 TaxID=3020845 RepID=UPI0025B0CADD|nr:fluoride efflux transporter CrcB [Paenibacillus sp. BSR1-1]MDN3015406.1 fluoride efflux transporter CrcB [Paenibacillus sp. BSR1-1]